MASRVAIWALGSFLRRASSSRVHGRRVRLFEDALMRNFFRRFATESHEVPSRLATWLSGIVPSNASCARVQVFIAGNRIGSASAASIQLTGVE